MSEHMDIPANPDRVLGEEVMSIPEWGEVVSFLDKKAQLEKGELQGEEKEKAEEEVNAFSMVSNDPTNDPKGAVSIEAIHEAVSHLKQFDQGEIMPLLAGGYGVPRDVPEEYAQELENANKPENQDKVRISTDKLDEYKRLVHSFATDKKYYTK